MTSSGCFIRRHYNDPSPTSNTSVIDDIRSSSKALASRARFWSIRYVEDAREVLAVRQDTAEPPRLQLDRGAMVTAIVDGGCGYCATGDLTREGLQAALDRATTWAEACARASVHPFDPRDMPAPRGERVAPSAAVTLSRSELYDLLADECRAARVDDRIVERYAALELREVDQLYLTNTGGDVRQRFTYTVPYMHAAANRETETQLRSFAQAQQGGLEVLDSRPRLKHSGVTF